MSSTPAPPTQIDVRSLAQIYKSGDLMLQNPAESCVIFVSVILVSAILEWILDRAGKIENKYARMMAETMTQEITIVGVLALLLMFGTSVIPKDRLQDRYIVLFTWANMCLFFMAVFFVSIIILQFGIATYDLSRWRLFEEGRMDSEELESMSFRERMYKLSFEMYQYNMMKIYKLSTTDIPYFEFLSLMMRKYLVKFSDLSYRTWLSLSVIVVANLMRAKLTPWLKKEQESTAFGNALLYIGCIGFGTMFVFLLYIALLHRRLQLFLTNKFDPKINPADAQTLVPFGAAKRGIEFVQVITMSTNWYITLFITGIAREATAGLSKWRLSIIMISFFIPVIVNFALIPPTIMTINILGTISTACTNKEVVNKLHGRVQGTIEDSDSEGDDGSSDDDTDGDEEEGAEAEAATGSKKGPSEGGSIKDGSVSVKSGALSVPTRQRGVSMFSVSGEKHMARPTWLEDDDYWDGQQTSAYAKQVKADERFNHLFYENIDKEELVKMLKKKDPYLVQDGEDEEMQEKRPHNAQARPIWLDDDEPWDPKQFQ